MDPIDGSGWPDGEGGVLCQTHWEEDSDKSWWDMLIDGPRLVIEIAKPCRCEAAPCPRRPGPNGLCSYCDVMWPCDHEVMIRFGRLSADA